MINFKCMELYGFKSFPDKTVIKFNSGITGIVGPNGCGKSNISDAIRWVLGEQSVKIMRGKQRTDVIFLGTDNRRRMSYAEVSLTFNNENRTFLKDDEQIIITRKVFGDGEGEYLVNGEVVRFKDIKELLRDTGIGKDGYSIIGQGRVKDIIVNNTEDRRKILEEAAGVSTYRFRKEESEKKLKKVQDNIIRLSDIISVMESEVLSLEKKSNNAKLCRDLQEKLKYYEINEFIVLSCDSSEKKKKINENLYLLKEQNSNLLKNIKEVSEQYAIKEREIEQLEINLNKLTTLKNEIILEETRLDGDNKVLLANLKNFINDLNKKDADISNYQFINDNKLIEIKEKLEEKEILIKKLDNHKIEHEKISIEYDKIMDELISMEGALIYGNKEKEDILHKIADTKANMSELRARLEAIDIKRGELSEENLTLHNELVVLKEKKSQCVKSLEALKSEKKRQEDSLKTIIKSSNEILFLSRDLNDKIVKKKEEIAALKSALELYNSLDGMYKKPVKALLYDRERNNIIREKLLGVFAELITVPAQYVTAIESALGAAMQHIVTANEEDANYLIRYIKQNQYGKITFLPITSMKPRELDRAYNSVVNEKGFIGIASDLISYEDKYDKVVSSQLGAVVVVDNTENALIISRKYRSGFKMVTLDGVIYATTGSITGGSDKGGEIGLLSKDKDKKSLDKCYLELEDLKDEQSIKECEIKDYKLDIERLGEVIKGKEIDINNATNLINHYHTDEESKAAKIVKNKEQLALLEIEKNAIKDRIDTVFNMDKMLHDKTSSSKEEIDTTHIKINDLKSLRDDLSSRKHLKDIDIKDNMLRLEQLDSDIKRLEGEVNYNKKAIEYTISESEKLKIKIDISQENIEKARFNLKNRDRINEIEDRINKLNVDKASSKSIKDELLENKDSLQEKHIEINSKIAREEGQLELINSRLYDMENRIYENYGLSYEQAVLLKDSDYIPAEGRSNIDKIKKKLSSIGSVDFNSIQEYSEKKEEYDKLNTQLIDCKSTKENLEKLIIEVTDQFLREFTTEFNKINESFKEIFKQLFNGGRCRLELVENNEDKLGFNVEIYAEPPGKKLQHITLLSGGEQSLTAIAIQFAILMLKPIPFCILDEIDADLDDVNCGLFADYLKKFAVNTQFIVITHKKVTMDRMDSIYGITMQEKGVTTIFDARLKDRQSLSKS